MDGQNNENEPHSSNSTNPDMMEEEDETISIEEILAGIAENESTAAAVLGGSDNEHCSYDKGYVKRQALYACLTCNDPKSPDFKPAGLCLACTLKCHSDHELVELYTKRNFRCDCGTSKFPNVLCTLQPIKDEVNEKNSYNHNFQGVYCICNRPYPDAEEEDDEDEMIQCVICEDWLHGRHMNNDEVDTETDINEAEFICESCAKKNNFLTHYYNQLQLQVIKSDENEASVNDPTENLVSEPVSCADETNQVPPEHKEVAKDLVKVDKSGMGSDDSSSQDSGLVLVDEIPERKSIKRPHSPGDTCLLQTVFNSQCEFNGGTWWKKDWRLDLCRCSSCMKVYEENNLTFLLDNEDLLEVYEAKGKEKGCSTEQFEQKLIESTMSRLDHVGKIEFLHGVQDLKQGLSELLRRVGESGRALTQHDVHTFFDELQAKRRRMN